jgi:predicted PurR-regulated permease PerM
MSAVGVLVMLLIFVVWLRMGVWGMILAPMLVQASYQNWKWPLEVVKEFKS